MPYKVKVVEQKPEAPERIIYRSGIKFSSEYYTYIQDDHLSQEIVQDRMLDTTWIDEKEYEQGRREARKRR